MASQTNSHYPPLHGVQEKPRAHHSDANTVFLPMYTCFKKHKAFHLGQI
jgi:hypothetical protein